MLRFTPTTNDPFRILLVIEAQIVTGPAKNMLESLGAMCSLTSDSAYSGTFLTYQRKGSEHSNHFVSKARAAGLEVDLLTERFRFDPLVIPGLRSVAFQRDPDLVRTNHVKSHFLFRLSGLASSYPWLAFHHGYTATVRKQELYNHLDRWSLRGADRVGTVCQAFARELSGFGINSERISVVHNAISPDYGQDVTQETCQELRASLQLKQDEKVILTSGRLSKEKAQADLISAFAIMRGQRPDIKARLVILGDGPERTALTQLAMRLGVSAEVNLVGHVNNVASWYKIADIFVLPSLSEGSPNSLLEAMAMKLPIVATRVGGIPEMVTDSQDALLVPARNVKDMATAIHGLLTNNELAEKLARKARETVLTEFAPEKRQREIVALYRQTVKDAAERRFTGAQVPTTD